MKIEDIVDIYRNSGYYIYKAEGYYFLKQGWLNYSFPFLYDIRISKSLLNAISWKFPISVIKTLSRIKNTYEFILETDYYGLDLFSSKIRNLIRKSLKNCEFKKPCIEDVIKNGLIINKLTTAKQDRSDRFLTDPQKWESFIISFYNHSDAYILGAYIEDRMIGYIMAYKLIDRYIILNPFYDRKASSSAPMNGLIYTLVNLLIEKEGRVKVSYGIESFSPLPNLDYFKISMLFFRVPTTRVYVINPLLIPLFKLIIMFYIIVPGKKSIRQPFIQKVVRLYQGHRIVIKTLQS